MNGHHKRSIVPLVAIAGRMKTFIDLVKGWPLYLAFERPDDGVGRQREVRGGVLIGGSANCIVRCYQRVGTGNSFGRCEVSCVIP